LLSPILGLKHFKIYSSFPEVSRAGRQTDRHTDRHRKGNGNIFTHVSSPLYTCQQTQPIVQYCSAYSSAKTRLQIRSEHKFPNVVLLYINFQPNPSVSLSLTQEQRPRVNGRIILK